MGTNAKEPRMEEVVTTARLAEPRALAETDAITTTVPRSEVEEALRAPDDAELYLDVARGDETSTIRVSWRQEDLEELLRQATGEQVTLTFDRQELEQALNADVEAHGLRDKALILTVAAATAGGLAAGAAAMPYTADEGGGAPVAALSGDWQSDAAGSGQTGVPAPSSTFQTDAAGSGMTGAPSPSSWQTDAASTGTGGGQPTASLAGDEGWQMPDPATTGAIAGGIALLIVGAGFMIRGQRQRPA
jgi:hypothetical protein